MIQENKYFFCYLSKLTCIQGAIFNPSIDISIKNKQGRFVTSASTFPVFTFNKKLKLSISSRDCLEVNSIKFTIYENSNELMYKSFGFSNLKGNEIFQDLEIQNDNFDKVKLYFRAMIYSNKKDPNWFSLINAEIVNPTTIGVRSVDSSFLDDLLLTSSESDDELIEEPNLILQKIPQSSNSASKNLKAAPTSQKNLKATPTLQKNNISSSTNEILQEQSIKKASPTQIFERKRTFSSNSVSEEEEKCDEEEEFNDEVMPTVDKNHEINGIELFVKAKCELLFRAYNEKIGIDIGQEFMKYNPINFTNDQKYAVLLLESYTHSHKMKSIDLEIRFFNCLMSIHQIVFKNKRLGFQIRRIMTKLIENIYKQQSADLISYVIVSLKSSPSSKCFTSNANKILKLRKMYIGFNGQFLFSKINELMDCDICNSIITKLEFSTYSVVIAASDNLPEFENMCGLSFPRLHQVFKTVIMRNDVISSPLIVKKLMPLLSSTFVFYLLSLVKPDKTIPQQLPFDKLQRFALTAEVDFRSPIENCFLKPKKLRVPKNFSIYK